MQSRIVEVSQKAAYRAVNLALVQCNWLLGYRIAQEELKGEGRSEYGTAVIRKLAKELTAEYGKGFDYSSLYKLYPEIVDSVSPQSGALLSWTRYRVLLQVEDKTARDWYTKEAALAHGRRTARRDWNAERNVLFAAQPK